MSITVLREENGLRVVRVTGLLKKGEQDAALNAEAQDWTAETRAKVLILARVFQGWERGGGWGDLTFFNKHNEQISRIAVVAEPKWEAQILMFIGAGLRRAAVKFFPLPQEPQARAWLAEEAG
jgi:hypothetical protein